MTSAHVNTPENERKYLAQFLFGEVSRKVSQFRKIFHELEDVDKTEQCYVYFALMVRLKVILRSLKKFHPSNCNFKKRQTEKDQKLTYFLDSMLSMLSGHLSQLVKGQATIPHFYQFFQQVLSLHALRWGWGDDTKPPTYATCLRCLAAPLLCTPFDK